MPEPKTPTHGERRRIKRNGTPQEKKYLNIIEQLEREESASDRQEQDHLGGEQVGNQFGPALLPGQLYASYHNSNFWGDWRDQQNSGCCNGCCSGCSVQSRGNYFGHSGPLHPPRTGPDTTSVALLNAFEDLRGELGYLRGQLVRSQ